MIVRQAGFDIFVLSNNQFIKHNLKYITWPTVPHPESVNAAFNSLVMIFRDKAPGIVLKLEDIPGRVDGAMVCNFYLNEALRHSVEIDDVCERIVQGQFTEYTKALINDLKNDGLIL